VNDAYPNGNQMTVIWHVDDLLVSCEDTFELTKLQCTININRGVKHHYLGMDLEFYEDRSLEVGMLDYVKDVINDFPEDVGRKSYKTPAASHLFQVQEDNDKRVLLEEQVVKFHHTVVQMLFLSARAQRDIQTAVAFLTTRVREPDEDDWGKLRMVIWYLNGTRRLNLKLTVDHSAVIKWWIDGSSHNFHPDCRGHTGTMMSIGKGAVASYSMKHKLNMKCSTELEIVSVDQVMPNVCWTHNFLEAQGYSINYSEMF